MKKRYEQKDKKEPEMAPRDKDFRDKRSRNNNKSRDRDDRDDKRRRTNDNQGGVGRTESEKMLALSK